MTVSELALSNAWSTYNIGTIQHNGQASYTLCEHRCLIDSHSCLLANNSHDHMINSKRWHASQSEQMRPAVHIVSSIYRQEHLLALKT